MALALAAGVGALRPASAALVVGGLLAAAALVLRRPLLLCVGVALLTSGLAHRSLAGLAGVDPAVVEGEITLLSDPEPAPGGVRAEARLGRRHVEVQARPPASDVLAAGLAGERFAVRGDLGPPPEGTWAQARHLAARLRVHRAEPGGRPGPVAGLTNALRRALVRGAAPLGADEQTLYAGLVVGDDRGQPPALVDSFRGAGLTHLLAVSGQNVAFVLVLAGAGLRRLRIWPRLLVTLVVVLTFVVLTRAEPSVVRAGAMAAVAATTVAVGRPLSRLRTLALAVTALLLVDPLLVRALGFQLSLAATLAIVLLATPLAARLPGPRWLATPLAVTLAAQVGVAPLVVSSFGPLPVASIPANLLVVPAAGAVMAWGMSAGLVAGAVPALAGVLHVPTAVLLWWIEVVASRAAAAPLGQVDGRAVAAIAVGAALALVARGTGARQAGAALLALVVLVAVAAAHAPPPLRRALGPGVVRWHGTGTDVVVLGGGGWRSSPRAVDVLQVLREDGVGAVDLVVVADDTVPASVVEAVTARHPTGAVVVHPGIEPAERPEGAEPAPSVGTALPIGGLLVLLVPGEDRLVVEAWPAAP